MVEELLQADHDLIERWNIAQGQPKAEVLLFCCPIPGIVNQRIVEALAEVPSIETLQTGLAHSIIEHVWGSVFMYVYLVDWLWALSVVATLCHLTYYLQQDVEPPKFPVIFIGFRVLQNLTDELLEAWRAFRKKRFFEYCVSLANIVDWSRLLLNCAAVVHLWQWQGQDQYKQLWSTQL